MLRNPGALRATRPAWQVGLVALVALSPHFAHARLAHAQVDQVAEVAEVVGQTVSPLEDAQRAYEASEFDEATTRLNAALRSGSLGPADLALAHRLLGILEVANGDSEGAMAEFALSLALDSAQPTPLELGPEQAALFDGIRAGRAPLGLELTHSNVEPGGRFVLTARLRAAPADLVHGYRLEADATGLDPWTLEATSEQIEVEGAAWRGAQALNVRVRAVDEHGNTVVSGSTEVLMPPPPEANELPAGGGAPVEPRRSKVGLIVGIVAGVVLVGAAVGIGVWAAGRPVPTSIEVNRP